MDEERWRAIDARLTRIEHQLGTVVEFTATLERLFGAWMSGARGKVLGAMVRRGGDRT